MQQRGPPTVPISPNAFDVKRLASPNSRSARGVEPVAIDAKIPAEIPRSAGAGKSLIGLGDVSAKQTPKIARFISASSSGADIRAERRKSDIRFEGARRKIREKRNAALNVEKSAFSAAFCVENF